ncbi:HAD family hydrolase [Aliagarivorans marinus]|uniref:HAD family hydrolase n=1 Tax=Aliagarivorans marinus TaxID=561965 RepID=UPI00041AAB0A|nr:HAD family hydrolase [Aliagarivorans marinus]
MSRTAHTLAVFDLDETLLSGDSSMLWHRFIVDQGLVEQADFIERDQALMAQYADGQLDMREYIRFSMQAVQHHSIAALTPLVDAFCQQRIRPRLYPDGRLLLKQLREAGSDLLIISASASFLVEPIARLLDVEHALGIDLHEDNGHYSTEVKGTMSFREGKVTRLQAWLTERQQHYQQLRFYTDSINDLPMCEQADFVEVINPCPRLHALAEQRDWPIHDWLVASAD